ncbi:MAG TPA: ABC transporter substrate-binding protein [Solirubrobacterales bacterium]|nr:ABC transporter substrate-binding protein [Solirubrobacterales bacterium]
MRIASLVPSSTEMLFALGLGDQVVAVTHECDHPAEAARLPHLSDTVIPPGLSPAEIDAEVKRVVGLDRPLYSLKEDVLRAAEPDLIIAQDVCAVCAVSYDDVVSIAARMPGRPTVLKQDPTDLAAVLDNAEEVAAAAGVPESGLELKRSLRDRIDRVTSAVSGTGRRSVVALEWLDPPFTGGHWVPEMIELAGGTDLVGRAGEKSAETTWEELGELNPDVVVVMPCGYYVDEAREQALAYLERIRSLGPRQVFAVDAAASYSRPGPRLVEGVELLGHLLYPELVDAPEGLSFEAVPID